MPNVNLNYEPVAVCEQTGGLACVPSGRTEWVRAALTGLAKSVGDAVSGFLSIDSDMVVVRAIEVDGALSFNVSALEIEILAGNYKPLVNEGFAPLNLVVRSTVAKHFADRGLSRPETVIGGYVANGSSHDTDWLVVERELLPGRYIP